MNLAYRYPSVIWDCACLINDSGGDDLSEDGNNEDEEESEPAAEIYSNEMEGFGTEDIDESYEEEEDGDGQEVEVVVLKDGKKKKRKVKGANYGKMATAIGKIRAEGVAVDPPDINSSSFTFFPDIHKNVIRYGLSGIAKVGGDLVQRILNNRPYSSIEDFTNKVKTTKPQLINLIKSGAFDELCGDRIEIMKNYVRSISDQKKTVNLKNAQMLINFKLFPLDFDFECRVFNFNKYLKKAKVDNYYGLDNIAIKFYETNFDMDLLDVSNDENYEFLIRQSKWDDIYQSYMNNLRVYIKAHSTELLQQMNDRLISDVWNKYCLGSLSKWEMDSVSFYSHDHELAAVNLAEYGVKDFNKLKEEPEIDRLITIKGKLIPLFKIERIIGTVLDKDKAKKTVTLLTTDGVVTVKVYGAVYANYDKQLSERGADGKKHIIEKSWFSRGNKIVVTGIRRGDMFMAKKYSKTPHHLVELIEQINEDGSIITRGERQGVEGEN